jgi:hypothetical protein
MAKNEWIISDAPETPKANLGGLGRTLVGGVTRGFQGLEGLLSLLPDPNKTIQAATEGHQNPGFQLLNQLSRQSQSLPTISQAIKNELSVTDEDLKSQGLFETIGQRGIGTLTSLPFLGGLSGGLQGLARTGAGALTGGLAEHANLPEWLQTASQLVGEVGTGMYQKAIPSFNQYKYDKYAQEPEELSKVIPIKPAKSVEKAFAKINKGMLVEKDSVRKAVKDVAERVESAFVKGEADVDRLLELRSTLFDEANTLSRDTRRAAPYIKDLSRSLKDSIKETVKNDPNWYNGLPESRQLTLWEKTPSLLENGFKWGVSVIPRSVLGKAPEDIINAVGKVIGTPEKAIHALQVPAIRKYHAKLLESIASNSQEATMKAARDFIKAFKSNEPKPKNEWVISN